VYFRIKAPGVGYLPIVIVSGSILAALILGFVIMRRMQARADIKVLKMLKKS
jgi:hypothetical protein